MKKLLIVLVLLIMVFASGCLPSWITPDEPEVPILVMKANVDAVLVADHIAWSIENVGDLFIREYVITFDVFYPMETKDIVVFTETGNYLEIGAKHEGIVDLVPYDTPETVSVSWELFE